MQNGRPNHSNRPVISLGDENDYVYPQETWNFSNKNLQNSNYLISRSPSMFEGHSGTFLLSADRLDRTFQESSHLEQSNNSFSSPHRGNPRSPSPEPVADETQIEALREVIEQKKLEIAQLQSESTQLEQKITVMQNYAREQRISELFSNENGQNGARSLGGLMIETEETHLKRMLRTQIDDVRESKTVITFMRQMNKGEPIGSRLTSYLSKRVKPALHSDFAARTAELPSD